MSENVLQPRTADEIREIIAGHPAVLPIGNRTKPCCSLVRGTANRITEQPALISMTELSGIIEYEPSEFTFTAQAGTRVSEIVAVLKARNQYLPFDPLLVDAGATLGGTVASNAAGPGRFRYGGVRDFLLAVRLITGEGETIFAGAKVVKNSAGFDIPKLMVGSLGRLGVMTELTFKVFPFPRHQTTIQICCRSHEEAVERISAAARSRWELDAIDYRTLDNTLFLRIAGPEPSNQLIAGEIIQRMGGSAEVTPPDESDRYWKSVGELTFAGPEATIVKVPTTTTTFLELIHALADSPKVAVHLSVAGSLVWLAIKSEQGVLEVDETLRQLSLAGLVLRGPVEMAWIGQTTGLLAGRFDQAGNGPNSQVPRF